MNLTSIEQLDMNIREAKRIIEYGTALDRLQSNRDFKQVFIKGYLEQEAIRLVHLRSDPSMQSPELQASIIKQIDAIAAIPEYFRKVHHQAMLAEKAIESDEATREELLEEGVGV